MPPRSCPTMENQDSRIRAPVGRTPFRTRPRRTRPFAFPPVIRMLTPSPLSQITMPDPSSTPLRWGIRRTDQTVQDRVRGALKLGGTVIQEGEASPEPPQGILIGQHGFAEAREALKQGLKTSAATPMTMNAAEFLRLAHEASPEALHLYDAGLYSPAFRTLKGHVRPKTLKTIRASVGVAGPLLDVETELVPAHLQTLHRVVLLGGPVDSILSAKHQTGTIDFALRFRTGSTAAVTLTSGVPKDYVELEAEAQLRWRIEGSNLFSGPAMATLMDIRMPGELGMLELHRILLGTAKPTLSLAAHHHVLQLCEALARGDLGSLP